MNREVFLKEVDVAFKMYEMINQMPQSSWHRILQIMEQIRNDELNKSYSQQQAAKLGRPVLVPDLK